MQWQAWVTGGVIIVMLAALGSGMVAADLAILGAVLVLMMTGVITPAEGFSGFASSGLWTVAMLYVVATGLRETGAISVLASRVLGRPKSTLEAQARLVLPVTGMSAFINNTPIVALFLPVLSGLSRRTGIPVSKLFMPLSAAAILGGVCTLIGTSTNVVVSGLIRQHNAQLSHGNGTAYGKPLPEFGMFTISAVGIPIAVCGVAYILLFGRKLLKDRSGDADPADTERHYSTAMRVAPDSPVVGKTVESAGLRHLPGLFLARLEREHETVVAVGPEEKLFAGDTLVFVGVLESVVDLQKIRGLVPVADPDGPGDNRPEMRHVEAVISPGSPLVGQTIRDCGFRTRYNAVIIGVHRHGQRLRGKLGDIDLRAGDTLLIEAHADFARRFKDSADFYLVSELDGSAAPRHERAWASIAVLAGVVAGLSFGLADEVVVAMIGAALMILLRCCTAAHARTSIDLSVLLVIGAAVGLGRAMEKTGLAAHIADHFVNWSAAYGHWAVLAMVYTLSVAFTALLNNNAAAVLMFPVTLRVAQQLEVDPVPLLVCMTVAASCEFSTPIGYQTSLMVMGPGGYKWSDYLRFGGPLTVLCGVVGVLVAALVY